MSFGFGIGDFIAVGELCWKLYSQVYKVSRDAPEELRGLNQELGNLHNTIQLLVEELKDEESVLRRSGDVRISLVNGAMSQSEETLKKMQQLSKRYAELQTPAKGQGKRLNPRIYWDRLKYSQELHTINDLRAKIMLHNSQLTLTLQGAQNSSLERIEKQNTQTDKKLDELRQLLSPGRAQRDRPVLTAPLDANALIELTDAFLQKAEFDNRPWASIGIDNWLQIGQWWLMKAESQLGAAPESHVHEDHATYNQGYINLLKACWILTDIIAIHPQRAHMGASNDRRAYHIQRLTQGATSKLNTLSTMTFQLEDLLTCTLDIWNLPPSTALTPRRRNTGDQPELKWQTPYGEILFQKFAEFRDDKLERSVECLVIIVIPSEQFMNALSLNLIVQNSMGQEIFRRRSTSDDFLDAKELPIRFLTQQDKRLLECILTSLLFFQNSPNLLPMDASMIYSAALLDTCAGAGQFLLDSNFQSSTTNKDIDALARSRHEFQIQPTTHISSIFQQIADRILEYIKQCSKCLLGKSDRMFWMQKHHCIWMLIYWLCDTFETFSELFEALGICSADFHPVSKKCLIICSLLREDIVFPQKLLSLMNLKSDWTLNNIDILLIAIQNDDTALLKSVIKRTEGMATWHWNEAWGLAWTRLNGDAMDAILSVPDVGHDFLHEALFWSVIRHRWDVLHFFSNFIRPHSQFFKKKNFELDYGDIRQIFLHCCAQLIYKGSLQDMEVFFDIMRRPGISFGDFSPTTDTTGAQTVMLSALASRKLSVLKLLCETCVVSVSTEAMKHSSVSAKASFDDDDESYISRQSQLEILTTARRISLAEPLLPLDLAIAFALDFEIVEYICRTGGRLQEGRNATDVVEPETLRKLRLTTSVADARKQNCHMKGLFYQICSTEPSRSLYIRGNVSFWLKCLEEEIAVEPISKVLRTTGRIIFEGDCRHLYNITDVSSGLTWQAVQNDLYEGELKDALIPMATSWPAPLSTQESWDDWRLKVIDILETSGDLEP